MIGKILDGRYELVEFIGRGGMALVYKAIDHRTHHEVAVKILRPEFNSDAEFLTRFDREAIAASKMSHHNIVNLLDVGMDGDCRYLVMEYVEGKTLKDVIQEQGALPPTTAAQIAIRILSALQHAHKNGIIHRDIKPQNILVHSEGLIKVADFGIARVAGSATLSKPDSVMGSVHYFSPEQARGEDVTFASDLYSVGVVMYEMLTGVVPFDGETPVAVALQHINTKPRPMTELKPDIPPALERVVMKALEKRPEDRYQSALEMGQDLNRAMNRPDDIWTTNTQDKPIRGITRSKKKPPLHIHNRRKTIVRIAETIAAIAVLALLIQGVISVYDHVVNATVAPYVIDEDEESAIRMIKRAGLVPEISRTSDKIKPSGIVLLQSPDYDVTMKKGETLFITVSTGTEEQAVPNLAGKTADQARADLEKLGFTLLTLPDRTVSDKPWDTVLSQTPAFGETLSFGGIVQVQLSGGKVQVPNLVGLTRDEALLTIQSLSLQISEIKEIPIQDETQFDRVAAQTFYDKSGAPVSAGQYVTEQTMGTIAVYVSQQIVPATVQEEGTP